MLKFFGLREIIYGMKRFSILMVAVTILFAALGFINAEDERKTTTTGVPTIVVYSSSKSYIISAKPDDSAEIGRFESDYAAASTVSAMITADFSKQYVFDKIINDYSAADIIKYTGTAVSEKDINSYALQECINAVVLPDTSIVNFFTTARDKDFSERLLMYFDEYFNSTITNQVNTIESFKFIGGTTVPIEYISGTDIPYSAPPGSEGLISSEKLKMAVVFGIIGFVMSTLAVMAYVVLRPSITTKNDFEYYGVDVIDDAKYHRNDKGRFASEAITNLFNKAQCSDICIVSSNTNKSFMENAENLGKLIKSDVVFSFGIVNNFTEFDKIHNKKFVVLIEKKGLTKHDRFESTIAMLKQYDIEVLGVVLI